MNKNLALVTSIMLVSPLQALAVDTASWTNWTTPTSGSFVQV